MTAEIRPKLTVISLGWGVQSWTMAAMVALGELPPVDYAIHADTTYERSETYQFARQWTPWLKEHGVKVVTVTDAAQVEKVLTHKTDIPAFTIDQTGEVFGQLRRQCTHRWKIVPMRRWVADELARRELKKRPGVAGQWLGITLDEWERAKDSDVKYITNRYPLLDLKMTRGDCLNWLKAHGLPSPGKSSCVFCPYHSRSMWQELKRNNGPDWRKAVTIDATVRDRRPPYPLYVHRGRVPLPEAVVIPEDHGATQLSLLDFADDDAECDSGQCFL